MAFRWAAIIVSISISSIFSQSLDFSIIDKILSPTTQAKRLVAENFTKNVYTVPGYSAQEKRDASDPPFHPSPECGDQFLNLTEGSFGMITSPNYPENYPPNLQCEWIIEGIPGTVVEATFFDIVTQPWLFSFSDYVSVSNTGEWDNYRRFAGDSNGKMPFTILSKESSKIVIRFVSSKWLNFRGFKMAYVVRSMMESHDSPPLNEYGSAFNNDLTAVCSSKPITFTDRLNAKFHSQIKENDISERMENHVRIVNGIETIPHQYPFMVIILTDLGAFCSGSLIDPNHVLTAAHCLESIDGITELQTVDLVFGVYNLTNRAENLYARQFRTVQYANIASQVFIHPNYDARSGANDIAIVRVNNVKITKYVQPVFLPSVYSESNSFSGWTLKTFGWGSVESDKNKLQLSPTLQEAASTVIPTGSCRREYSGSASGNNICTRNPFVKAPVPVTTTPESLTSVGPNNGTDELDVVEVDDDTVEYTSPCHGDSGAPLVAEFDESNESGLDLNKSGPSNHGCVNSKQNGAGNAMDHPQQHDTACQRPKNLKEKWFVQVGVLSFGSKVCGRRIPVVYTRVTAYLEWIWYITGRHG